MSRPGFCPWLAAGAPTDWWGRLRDLTGPVPTYKLAGDITYLRTGQGWLFLATVVDLNARMVAGWACVRAHGRRHSRLSPRAGPQARPQGRRAISHSDRNSQHTSRMLASWAREDDVGPRAVSPAAATATRRQSPSSRPSEARCTAAARLPRARRRSSP